MKRLLAILACIGICSISLLGETTFMDGYGWLKLGSDKNLKLLYIYGLSDGAKSNEITALLAHSGINPDYPGDFAKEFEKSEIFVQLGGATYGQIIEGVDEIYRDYANRLIPVSVIATLVSKRIRGEVSEQDLPNELQRLRSFRWLELNRYSTMSGPGPINDPRH